MTDQFAWGNDHLELTFWATPDAPVSIGAIAVDSVSIRVASPLPLVEILAAGWGHWVANDRLVHTTLGRDLRYVRHGISSDERIKQLIIELVDSAGNLSVVVTCELPHGVAMLRSFATVTNRSPEPLTLESVTSWVCPLGAPESAEPDIASWRLTQARFDWLGEGRWHTTPLRQQLPRLAHRRAGADPRGAHTVVSTGTWSTGRHAPLALLESEELNLAWVFQVEHNGPWRWEIGEHDTDAYLALAGPTLVDHAWQKTLQPGESFTTVPASVAPATSLDAAVAALTAYRRAQRRPHPDNTAPKVVFNDYMNTIQGDPTTAKLLPLIDSAAAVGAEVFCIDCGWYDETGDWWPSVGEWLPSTTRFPGGITQVIDHIHATGMVPGIWIEPEVIGVQSPIAQTLPDSAFLQRSGKRVTEHERYLLDFRDPAARGHLDAVIQRLVDDYRIGYFKFDYNVSPGAGTDHDADSPGDGLLEHQRAYTAWIDSLHDRYPQLILENCSSGGMREDFAQTSRFQVQSTSDQQDFMLYPPIAAAAPLMMLPEQAGNWAYPQTGMQPEEIAFNLSTTLLGRFFLSGYLNRMDDAEHQLIAQAVEAYKTIVRPLTTQATPFWPLGLPRWDDTTVALGLRAGDRSLITAWHRGNQPTPEPIRLRIPHCDGQQLRVSRVFPTEEFAGWPATWDAARGVLTLHPATESPSARTFLLTQGGGESQSC